MKNLILVVLLISISSEAYFAQDVSNLILNPSFESMNGKLKKLKQINVASEWDSPTALKADLYSMEKIYQYLLLLIKGGKNFLRMVITMRVF